jgi:hypothetical protein
VNVKISTVENAQGDIEYIVRGDVELDPKTTKFVKENYNDKKNR